MHPQDEAEEGDEGPVGSKRPYRPSSTRSYENEEGDEEDHDRGQGPAGSKRFRPSSRYQGEEDDEAKIVTPMKLQSVPKSGKAPKPPSTPPPGALVGKGGSAPWRERDSGLRSSGNMEEDDDWEGWDSAAASTGGAQKEEVDMDDEYEEEEEAWEEPEEKWTEEEWAEWEAQKKEKWKSWGSSDKWNDKSYDKVEEEEVEEDDDEDDEEESGKWQRWKSWKNMSSKGSGKGRSRDWDEEEDGWWNRGSRKGKGKDKGNGKGKDKGKGKGKRRRLPPGVPEEPERLCGDKWEEPREAIGLELVGEISGNRDWEYVLEDDSRRCYAGFLRSPLERSECKQYFERIREGTNWLQPEGPKGPIPRKTAWMVKRGCSCTYRYGQIEVPPADYPSWMTELMGVVMPHCGLHDKKDWPDSCNVNLYTDGAMSVGWHSDDEKIFQGKFRDITIISLSLGVKRKFELRANWPEDGEKQVQRVLLGSGDIMTMEGMVQKHFMHRVPKEDNIQGPRINLTWRWVLKHTPKCPCGRNRS